MSCDFRNSSYIALSIILFVPFFKVPCRSVTIIQIDNVYFMTSSLVGATVLLTPKPTVKCYVDLDCPLLLVDKLPVFAGE